MTKTIPRPANGRFRVRVGLILTFLGFILFLIGAVPGLFGLDRSTIIGLVQIGVFLIGLAAMCIGGYICMNGLWNNVPKTIQADIGLRLVSTGYVIAAVSGMADVFGFGSQLLPEIPYFGHWQMRGVIVGEAVIALGFLLLIPYRLRRRRFSGATFIPPR
ncbi:MAG TPA: hypothetical protein VGA03_10770 [Anaerolineales bacterium]